MGGCFLWKGEGGVGRRMFWRFCLRFRGSLEWSLGSFGLLFFFFLGEKGGGCFPSVFSVFGVEFVLFSMKNCLCGDDVFFFCEEGRERKRGGVCLGFGLIACALWRRDATECVFFGTVVA